MHKFTKDLKKLKRKIKSFESIMKVKRKFQFNCHIKYICYTLIAFIIVFIFLYPTADVIVNNETMFTTILGCKFKDHNSLVAAIIGILAFFATIYAVDMNYKSVKLSSLPDNAIDLMIYLEYYFNEYKIDKQNNEDDIITFFIDILRFWRIHQKAFRLLSPKFYKNFLNFYSMHIKIDDDNIAQKNSNYIIKAMKTQIMGVAFDTNVSRFYFIKPSLITKDIDIQNIKDSKENFVFYKLDKEGLKSYIDDIHGETNKLTAEKFEELCLDLENLVNVLEEEISNYDLL